MASIPEKKVTKKFKKLELEEREPEEDADEEEARPKKKGGKKVKATLDL